MIPLQECVHKFGDVVWHKTDGDVPGVVTGIMLRDTGVSYEVTWQGRTTELHVACELVTEPPKFSSSEPEERYPT